MVFADPKAEARIGFAIFISIIAVMVLHTIFVIYWLIKK